MSPAIIATEQRADELPIPPALWSRLMAIPADFYGRVELDYQRGRIVGFRIIESVRLMKD